MAGCFQAFLPVINIKSGFVQKTRPKNQGLFKDFPAPNNIFPGPFYFH